MFLISQHYHYHHGNIVTVKCMWGVVVLPGCFVILWSRWVHLVPIHPPTTSTMAHKEKLPLISSQALELALECQLPCVWCCVGKVGEFHGWRRSWKLGMWCWQTSSVGECQRNQLGGWYSIIPQPFHIFFPGKKNQQILHPRINP